MEQGNINWYESLYEWVITTIKSKNVPIIFILNSTIPEKQFFTTLNDFSVFSQSVSEDFYKSISHILSHIGKKIHDRAISPNNVGTTSQHRYYFPKLPPGKGVGTHIYSRNKQTIYDFIFHTPYEKNKKHIKNIDGDVHALINESEITIIISNTDSIDWMKYVNEGIYIEMILIGNEEHNYQLLKHEEYLMCVIEEQTVENNIFATHYFIELCKN